MNINIIITTAGQEVQAEAECPPRLPKLLKEVSESLSSASKKVESRRPLPTCANRGRHPKSTYRQGGWGSENEGGRIPQRRGY